MKVNTSNNPLQTPKKIMQSAPSEETRETRRMKAEETRRAEVRQSRQAGPDGAGLQINIQA
jgi:hypothetical protein